MENGKVELTCNLKAIRLARGMSQVKLAELIGVKRQAIYDIEIGKYTPNTAVALRLARHLGCTVEDLFREEEGDNRNVTLVGEVGEDRARVAMARIRGRLLAYPLTGNRLTLEGFEPADGIVEPDTGRARLLCPAERLERSVILFGCDPAFSILGTHAMHQVPDLRVHCLFASSHRAVNKLAAGQAHVAGTHLHNTPTGGESNVRLVREVLGKSGATIIAFSRIEEGLMVAPGNPLGIQGVKDLGGGRIRLINREPGAALRILLDSHLQKHSIPPSEVAGYGSEATTHRQSALQVVFDRADAGLGFRAIARAYGLDFVPIESVRCDLIIPGDLMGNQDLNVLLDTLQTKKLRADLKSLPGYETADTGTIVARI